MIAFVCSRLYSPEYVEEEFCELRHNGVLRSCAARCASGTAPSLPSTPQLDLPLSPALLLACAKSGSRAPTLWQPVAPHLARPPHPSPRLRLCSTSASSSERRDR